MIIFSDHHYSTRPPYKMRPPATIVLFQKKIEIHSFTEEPSKQRESNFQLVTFPTHRLWDVTSPAFFSRPLFFPPAGFWYFFGDFSFWLSVFRKAGFPLFSAVARRSMNNSAPLISDVISRRSITYCSIGRLHEKLVFLRRWFFIWKGWPLMIFCATIVLQK